jgi:hypothetical protein
MKYIWLVALLLLLAGTWSLGDPARLTNLNNLTDRQTELAELIRAKILETQPDAVTVNFTQLYLETILPDEALRAHYHYQIISKSQDGSESTVQAVEGTSLLHSSDGGRNWQLSQTELTEPSVEFSNGVTISPQKEHDSSEPELKQ